MYTYPACSAAHLARVAARNTSTFANASLCALNAPRLASDAIFARSLTSEICFSIWET